MKAGVEIEGYVNPENRRVKDYSYKVRKNWIVKYDSSVVGGYELVTPPKKKVSFLLKKIEKLKESNFNFHYKNGIHIHFSLSERQATALFCFYNVSDYYSFLIKDRIKGLLIKSLTNYNNYSNIVYNRNIYRLNKFQLNLLSVTYNSNQIIDRYLDINYNNRHFTAEYRTFLTKDLNKIKAFIEFLKEKEKELNKLSLLSLKNYDKFRKKVFIDFYNKLVSEKKQWDKLINSDLVNYFEIESGLLSEEDINEAYNKIEKIINNIETNIKIMKETSHEEINIFDLIINEELARKVLNKGYYDIIGRKIKDVLQ